MSAGMGDQDYETITASGQTIRISDGETYENKLIDVSNGAGFTIYARGASNWTIRNIGVKGYYEGGGFAISATDGSSSGESLVENLYLADGASKSGASFVHGPGAIFVGPSGQHYGHITFRECNVQGFPNNGFYCSNGPGSIKFENCLAVNNGVSNFRCGSTPGDEIRNCVAYNDNTDYGWYHKQNDYVEENGRPLWMWPSGNVDVYNTHLSAGTYPGAIYIRGGTVTYHSGAVSGSTDGANLDSSVGSTPDLTPPAGVPMTPEQAASGGGGSSGGGSQPDDGSGGNTGGSGGDSDDGSGGGDPNNKWSSPTPPAEPDSSDPMTGVSFHNVADPGDIVIRNCDFTWLGDGKVARDRTGSGTFRNCRFRGQDPEADETRTEEDG